MPDLDDMVEQLRRLSVPAPARPWYELQAKAGQRRAQLRIYDEIGWFGTSARSLGEELAELDVDEIDLRLNSPGGSAHDGVAIYNALRSHKARVVVTVDGMAASAASLVAMAGDEVRMNRGSQMMVHAPWGAVIGNADDMAKGAEIFGKLADSYADIYAHRAGGTAGDWREAMRDESWYTAAEAVDAGLADAVVDDVGNAPAAGARAAFDLTAYAFAYAGRDAAPPPRIPHPKTTAPPPAPAAAVPPAPQSAAAAMRRVHAAATKTTPASPAGGNQKGATQVDLAKLREALGLAQDVSDDEVKAAAFAALQPPAAPAATDPPTGGQPAPAVLAAAPGTVVLSQSVWEQTQQQIASLASFVEQTKRNERDGYLDGAIAQGKFTPAQKAQFAQLWDSNPDGTRALIDSMQRNSALAVEAVGYATADGDEFEREYQQMLAQLGGSGRRG